MPEAGRTGGLDARSARGLDWLNFFVANLQTAFGPFVAVYLTGQHWTQGEIGLVLTVGTVTAMASQVPAGWLVDRLRDKHRAAGAAIVAIVLSCLILAVLPDRLPVTLAEVLHGFASCMLNPAIAAITLSVVAATAVARTGGGRHADTADAAEAAHLALGERFGRNASFGSVGNAVAAGLMGATGVLLSARATFFLGAALALPGLLALRAIARPSHPPHRVADEQETRDAPEPGHGLRDLLRDRRLYGFAVCVVLFHLANAGMLPLAAGQVTRRAAGLAELVIAACILLPQLLGAALSPRIGRWAGLHGRKPVMLLCFSFLPLRGLILAVSSSPAVVVGAQLLDSVSSAAFGVLLPLVAADLSRGTGRFNLCLGLLGLFMGAGASFSTTLSGLVADRSVSAGFLVLAGAGLLCVLAVLFLVSETAPAPAPRPRVFPSRRPGTPRRPGTA